MSALLRGATHALRGGLRSIAIILILGLASGVGLTMALAKGAVDQRLDEVHSTVGTTIIVTAAGARGGFDLGGQPLTDENVSKVAALPHVASVHRYLIVPLRGNETNLQNTFQQDEARQGGGRRGGNFGMTLLVGTDQLVELEALGGGAIQLTQGTTFDPTGNQSVALIGSGIATANHLAPGSTFAVHGNNVTVAGVFASNTRFLNDSLLVPLLTAQFLGGAPGELTTAYVHSDSLEHTNAVLAEIQTTLGSGGQAASAESNSQNALTPLESVSRLSVTGMVVALVAGAMIILFAMVMTVRERRREIGILKAIGASNLRVVTQFAGEASVLALAGCAVGLLVGVLAGNSALHVLLASNTTTPTGFQGGPGGGRFGGGAFGAQAIATNLQTAPGAALFVIALVGTLILALVGTILPAYKIAKVRPAEVLRSD